MLFGVPHCKIAQLGRRTFTYSISIEDRVPEMSLRDVGSS